MDKDILDDFGREMIPLITEGEHELYIKSEMSGISCKGFLHNDICI